MDTKHRREMFAIKDDLYDPDSSSGENLVEEYDYEANVLDTSGSTEEGDSTEANSTAEYDNTVEGDIRSGYCKNQSNKVDNMDSTIVSDTNNQSTEVPSCSGSTEPKSSNDKAKPFFSLDLGFTFPMFLDSSAEDTKSKESGPLEDDLKDSGDGERMEVHEEEIEMTMFQEAYAELLKTPEEENMPFMLPTIFEEKESELLELLEEEAECKLKDSTDTISGVKDTKTKHKHKQKKREQEPYDSDQESKNRFIKAEKELKDLTCANFGDKDAKTKPKHKQTEREQEQYNSDQDSMDRFHIAKEVLNDNDNDKKQTDKIQISTEHAGSVHSGDPTLNNNECIVENSGCIVDCDKSCVEPSELSGISADVAIVTIATQDPVYLPCRRHHPLLD